MYFGKDENPLLDDYFIPANLIPMNMKDPLIND